MLEQKVSFRVEFWAFEANVPAEKCMRASVIRFCCDASAALAFSAKAGARGALASKCPKNRGLAGIFIPRSSGSHCWDWFNGKKWVVIVHMKVYVN